MYPGPTSRRSKTGCGAMSRASASALTRTDPLLLMECDPPDAHEFVIGLAAPSSDDRETVCRNDADGVACGRFFVRRESVSSSRPTSESAARAAAVKGGGEQPAATRSAL